MGMTLQEKIRMLEANGETHIALADLGQWLDIICGDDIANLRNAFNETIKCSYHKSIKLAIEFLADDIAFERCTNTCDIMQELRNIANSIEDEEITFDNAMDSINEKLSKIEL